LHRKKTKVARFDSTGPGRGKKPRLGLPVNRANIPRKRLEINAALSIVAGIR